MPRPKGVLSKLNPNYVKQNYVPPVPTNPGIAKVNEEAAAARDLAAEFAPHEPTEAEIATRFKKGNKSHWGLRKDPVTGKMVPGVPAEGHGTVGCKKGNKNHKAVKAIKDFMVELLDDEHYRMTLVRRIKAGELPGVELFLLTKALGKPKEEITVTANVPLFALPASFVMKEDEVDAESVRLIEAGDAPKED